MVEEDLFDEIALEVWLDPEIILPPTANVSGIMASWTRQAGLPLITVQRNYNGSTEQVTLRQDRYYSYPPTSTQNTTWWVPYNLATPSNPGFENTRVEGWIPNTQSFEITVDNLGADDYLLINKQSAGYYRVLYDERNYKLISDAVIRNSSLFHSANIAQLIDDAFEFYETGRLPITAVLDLLRVLEYRSDYVSWAPAFNFIYYVNRNFQGHRNYDIWADFVRSLTEALYDSVGVEDIADEPILNKLARENIVHLACQTGSVHCRSDANRKLRRYIETGEEFHHNVRTVARCASMRSASRTDFHTMWNILQTLPFDDFAGRYDIIDMLGCSASRPLLNEFVRSAFNLTMYGEFEQYSVINAVLQNGGNLGVSVTLEMLIGNFCFCIFRFRFLLTNLTADNAERTIEVFGSWFLQNLAYYVSNANHIDRVS